MSGIGFGTPGTPDRVKDPEREPPLHPQAPTGDILVGGAACAATMCALHARYADGQGRLVDIPAQAALATFTLADVMVYSYAHILRGRHPVGHMGIPNDLFPCQDGWVIIAAPTPAQWESLVEVMGRPAWASGEGFQTSQGRASLQGELTQRIQEWTLSLTGEEITRLCQAKGVPSFHYHGVPQVVTSDHLAARNAFRQLDIGGCSALAPGTLVGVKGGCTPRRRRGPHLGEHTSEVLAAVAMEKTSGTRSSIDQGQPMSQTRLPLAGIRVVDLTQFIAGPYTGQLLGWMGAEVILVESRSRPRAPAAGSTLDSVTRASVDFVQTNKRAVTLDLKHPEGLSLLKELVQVSDVVIDKLQHRCHGEAWTWLRHPAGPAARPRHAVHGRLWAHRPPAGCSRV